MAFGLNANELAVRDIVTRSVVFDHNLSNNNELFEK